MPSPFSAGYLLRVNDYEFDDDGSDRDKYMIVLSANDNEASVIHCLTTKNNRYSLRGLNSGCNAHHNNKFWFFKAGEQIGNMNYSFDLDTFVFFYNNIRKCDVKKFDSHVKKGIFGIAHLDILPTETLKKLISCIISSEMASEEIEDELIYLKGTL